MANKRMFNIKIVDSDAFLDMPLSTQALYFHLNMRADDDGFVGNPKRIKNLIGASDDDLKLLIAKRFLLSFEDGVIVIKHWRLHNTIRKDRYTQTVYTDELKQLGVKENKSYTFGNQTETIGIQNVSTDIDLDKDLDLGKEEDKEKDLFVAYANGNDELLQMLKEFEKMRKKIKKPLVSDSAKQRLLNKLDKLALDDLTKIAILDQSIFHCWQDVYELKAEKKDASNTVETNNPFLKVMLEGES